MTGVGVVSALGSTRDDLVSGLRDGRSGIRELSLFDCSGYRSRWAGQAPDPTVPTGPRRRSSRADLLALQAAAEAIEDSCLEPALREEAAIIIGTGTGGSHRTTTYQETLVERGERSTPASWLIPHQPATSADLIAERFRMYGPRSSIMTACSSSATAIGVGLDLIRRGQADRVLAGGTESLCHLTFGGFSALRAIDEHPCRPFHARRKGLTLGDGAAMLMLEASDAAAGRGVTPYAAVLGYGVSADAHHLTAPHPEGRGAIIAMRTALDDAGIAPDEVDYINAHGTATLHNDPIETRAIRAVFGRHADRLMVSSTKAMTGHTLGAAGALESAICCLAISGEFIPPTLRLDVPDPECDLDLVPFAARNVAPRTVLTNSFAFGGNNTSVLFRRCP